MGPSELWGGDEMLVDVFIDRACGVAADTSLRRLKPASIEVGDGLALQRLSPGGILLIGARTSDGASALPTIRAIRCAYPGLIIVLCVEWQEASRICLSRWIRAGIDEYVTFGQSLGVAEVQQMVQGYMIVPPPVDEIRMLRSTLPASSAQDAVIYCLRNAFREFSVPDVSRRLGFSPRAFRDMLADAGYPKPRDVWRVGRFLQMAELLDRGIAVPQELARRLGFADSTEMRRAKWRLRNSVAHQRERALGRFLAMFPRLRTLLSV